MRNRIIVFTGKGKVELHDEPVPQPTATQILVETQKTLISTGTECICFNRSFEPETHWDEWVKYPFYPGYNNVGIVRTVGSQVTDFQVGQRVVSRQSHRAYWLADGTPHEQGALPVPDDVPDEAAVWFGLGHITQIGVRAANHMLGDDVVVIGSGVIGQLIVQYGRLMGARTLTVIDPASSFRLDVAKQFGATHTLRMPADEAFHAVHDITDGRMASVVYDATGHAPVFRHALALAQDFGTVVLIGDTGTPSEQTLSPDIIRRGVRIVGAHDSHPPREATRHTPWNREAIVELFMTYVERGELRPHKLITHRFSPEDAATVYEQLTRDRSHALGVLFDWTTPPSQ